MKMKVIKPAFRERMYRRRFLIPNAVTLGNLFCGFLSIIYSCSGRYEKAVIAIAIAVLLDGLDGRLARRFKATSKFGVEFDSFSDLISFGLAPAMLVYQWGFRPIADEFGVIVTFTYAMCAAARLARFNVSQSDNLNGFTGLPTPAAASAVVTTVHLIPHIEPSNTVVAGAALVMVLIAYLMVSNVPYVSPKRIKMKGGALFVSLGALIALLWYFNTVGLFVVAVMYLVSGPIMMLFRRNPKPSSVSATGDGAHSSPTGTNG